VLVNGAGGGVGSIALQFAKAQGATVTGVEHTDKLELLRSLGADHVIDYTAEDVTRGDARYDIVFDVASNLGISAAQRILSPDGIYVLIGHDHYGGTGRRWLGELPRMFGLMFRTPFNRHLPPTSFAFPDKQEIMRTLADLLAKGQLTPVVGRTFSLDEVRAAMRALTDERTLGRVVLTP
jgi:NADPH:quinone reductase-like Zn-dependent oxidoreductase